MEAGLVGRGRPIDAAGGRRKAALVGAWKALTLSPAPALAARTKASRTLWYAWVDPGRPNQPSDKALRVVAVLFRDLASRIASEADRLERVADDTGE